MECWEEAKASLNFLTFLLPFSKWENTQSQETVFFILCKDLQHNRQLILQSQIRHLFSNELDRRVGMKEALRELPSNNVNIKKYGYIKSKFI
jgi:hypothetical protein